MNKQLPSPLVVTAFDAVQASRDSAYPLLQEANFLWLTGICEPGWCAVVCDNRLTLGMPERSDVQRLFDGGLSADEAKALSGADAVLEYAAFDSLLRDIASTYKTVYTLGADPMAAHGDFALNPAPARLRRRLKKMFVQVEDARPILSKERAIKQPHEQAVMQTAVDVTMAAFEQARTDLQKGTLRHEYELEAVMTRAIRSSGATGHAYEPIVASGKNALTLHWSANTDALPQNGLVLIDVGARVNGYAADITRTYAIGTPTARERAVHAAVETAQRKIIDLIKPGVELSEYLNDVDEIMKDALQSLGLLEDRDDTETYRRYFPHAISHGLGIDVHESLGGFTTFQPGMILTVEPGIYIAEEGIGVRIEDDILVTKTGNRNMSEALPTSL